MRPRAFALALLLLLNGFVPLSSQEVRGRVVDEATRSGIASAKVVLISIAGDTLRQTSTGPEGFFTMKIPAAGDYIVHVQYVGYGDGENHIHVGTANVTLPAFVLRVTVIKLDSLRVSANQNNRSATVGFAHATYVVSGSRMAFLERQGARPLTVVRELPNVRMRNIPRYTVAGGGVILNYTCIESVRKFIDFRTSGCDPVVMIVDGIVVGDPYDNLRSLSLADIESLELLNPVEAGFQYGPNAAAVGALVIWTRGRGPHESQARDGRS